MNKELTLRVTDLEKKAIVFCREKEVTFPIANYLVDFATEVAKELEKACDETQELLDKQIEATYKLDKENAELKARVEKQNGDILFLKGLTERLRAKIEATYKLVEENKGLKEAVKHFNPCGEWDDDVHDCEFRHYAMEYGSKLTTAKEIIKGLLSFVDSLGNYSGGIFDKAEQFIKE